MENNGELTLKQVPTFSISDSFNTKPWDSISWTPLCKSFGTLTFDTRFKATWCEKGIYFLIDCEDTEFSCSGNLTDFDDIYTEDAVEVFLQPDPRQALYLEHEVSPYNKELTLLVPQDHGTFMGWIPWKYTGDRKIQHRIYHNPNSKNWSAEIFIPFILMTGMAHTPPQKGSTWHANICRLDYADPASYTLWSWRQMTSNTFHNLKDFGMLHFE